MDLNLPSSAQGYLRIERERGGTEKGRERVLGFNDPSSVQGYGRTERDRDRERETERGGTERGDRAGGGGRERERASSWI